MRTTQTAARSFTISRHLVAPPDRVFRAWTEPGELDAWYANLPPRLETTVDLRVGGAWRLEMRESEDRAYVTGGIYRELRTGRRLVFAWGAEGGWPELGPDNLDEVPQVSVVLTPAGAGTELAVTVSFDQAMADADVRRWLDLGVEPGWRDTVARLDL